MNTPWGKSDWQKKVAVGINWYSTPSHGGVKVSAGKNKLIPEYMRNESGWYEEDSDWAIPYVVLDQYLREFVNHENLKAYVGDYESAVSTLKSWKPYSYEKFYNMVLKDGESHIKDRDTFIEKTKNDYVAYSAVGHGGVLSKGIPEGMVGVYFKRKSDSSQQRRLVFVDDYQNRSKFGFVIKSDEMPHYEDWWNE